MRDSLQKICKNFIHNRDTIKNSFRWDSQLIIPVCASNLCENNVLTDAAKLNQCKKIIDNKTGVFSNFRGTVKLPIITMLAASDYPEHKFNDALEIYNVLKKHFFGTEYLTLVATILTDMISVSEAEAYAARGKRIYELMKSKHPFLTSGEDSVFAVLMAFSEKTDAELITDMEACYTILKKTFSDSNAVQSLTHVFALVQGTPEEKCAQVIHFHQELNRAGRKYGKHYELAVLGALSIVAPNIQTVVADIICVDDFLANQSGYNGFFGIDKRTRLMQAAMLTACDYTLETNTTTAAMTGTLAMIAAQQAAMCAVVAASAAASSANN